MKLFLGDTTISTRLFLAVPITALPCSQATFATFLHAPSSLKGRTPYKTLRRRHKVFFLTENFIFFSDFLYSLWHQNRVRILKGSNHKDSLILNLYLFHRLPRRLNLRDLRTFPSKQISGSFYVYFTEDTLWVRVTKKM